MFMSNERYVNMGRSVMFDVGRCASWTKNEIDFARWWRLEVDRDMVDRADMIKEIDMIRDGVLCWSEADFTPEDAQACQLCRSPIQMTMLYD